MEYSEWQKDWFKLVDKCEIYGYHSLTSDERIWYNIRVLIDSVENGGLISYYYNSGADHLKETMEDLQILNAYQIIDTIKAVNQLFPNGEPSDDIDRRNDIISSWEENETRLDELLARLDQKFFTFQSELEAKLDEVVKRVILP